MPPGAKPTRISGLDYRCRAGQTRGVGRVPSFNTFDARPQWLLGVVLACVLGCNQDPPPVRWTGESLVYHAEETARVCAGSFTLQDDYVRRLSEMLQIELERPISFSLLDPQELESVCDRETILGCEFESDVYSARPVHFHELAHAVARRGGVRGSEAFREGFAEALSNGFEPKKPRVDLEPVLRNFAYLDADYYTAGLFTRFLIERHGLTSFASFLKRTSKDDSFEVVSVVFAEVFGEPLTAAMDEFDDYPSCAAWSNRLALVECGLAETPWVGTSWAAEVAVECSDEDVLGPLVDGNSLIWATRALVIDVPGDFIARSESAADGDSTVRLTRCGSCWDELDLTVLPGQEKQFMLPEGRYYVTFIKELDQAGSLKFSLERIAP